MAARNRQHSYFAQERKARLEIVPMIDIMMFLLVFFMLITLRMIEGSGLALELPRSDTAQRLQPARYTVGVDPTGRLYLEGAPIAGEELTARLRAARGRVAVDVVIAGDQNTPYQAIIAAMDRVRAAGVESVALTTRSQ